MRCDGDGTWQWLDVVHQVHRQFPSEFEFTPALLLLLSQAFEDHPPHASLSAAIILPSVSSAPSQHNQWVRLVCYMMPCRMDPIDFLSVLSAVHGMVGLFCRRCTPTGSAHSSSIRSTSGGSTDLSRRPRPCGSVSQRTMALLFFVLFLTVWSSSALCGRDIVP